MKPALIPPYSVAATALAQVQPNAAGAKDVGNGQGLQFTTGGCVSDADCQEGCCADNGEGTGVCSGIGAEFQNGKQGTFCSVFQST